MANFVEHEPCPKCGSRDNLGRYDDGSAYCFGCSYYEPSDARKIFEKERSVKIPKIIPDDFSAQIAEDGVKWAQMYDVNVPELLHRDVGWSGKRQQLIFTWKDGSEIILWQARNFSKDSRSKYFTGDGVNGVCPIYPFHPDSFISAYLGRHIGNTIRETRKEPKRTLVLTEDALSAIKIARWCDSMPCLGSTISLGKLSALRPFYDFLGVWLDSDKWSNAVKLSDQAKMLGYTSRAIFTEKDPKEYNDDVILSKINLIEGV